MKVIAAIQPSDFSEPGPQEVIRIIKQIKKENVPAIFGSEVFPSKVMEQIARETGVSSSISSRTTNCPPTPRQFLYRDDGEQHGHHDGALGGDPDCMANVDTSNISPLSRGKTLTR